MSFLEVSWFCLKASWISCMVASLIDEKPWAVLMAWALDDVVARRIKSSDTFYFHVFFFFKKVILKYC